MFKMTEVSLLFRSVCHKVYPLFSAPDSQGFVCRPVLEFIPALQLAARFQQALEMQQRIQKIDGPIISLIAHLKRYLASRGAFTNSNTDSILN